jgi:ADP-ribose pyrophosphatase YjhB (NUDIX family)
MGYNNPKVVAVGLVRVRFDRHPLRLTGIYRGKASDDGFGKPALNGGWVNEGETIEQAVARETREEIGFNSDPSKWRLLHSRHVPQHNINLVFCLYDEIVEVDILKDAQVSEEVSGFIYIDKTTKLAFDLHEEAVQLFYSKYMVEAALLESAARVQKRLSAPDMSIDALRARVAMAAAWEEANGPVSAFCGKVVKPDAE